MKKGFVSVRNAKNRSLTKSSLHRKITREISVSMYITIVAFEEAELETLSL